MKKNICTIICTLLLIGSLHSIGRGQEASAVTGRRIEGGEIRFGLTTEPATFDPLSPSNTADGRSVLFNIFEGLVKPTPDGSLKPAVAESYTIEENGRIYVFKLRPALKFNDGSFVNPEDVEFTLNTAINAGLNGFSQIEKVEISQNREIRITLKARDVEFLSYLTVGVVPRSNNNRERQAIGTGPFLVESYNAQRSLVLVKNPYYWQTGLPYLDKVTYIFVSNSDALLLGLQGGNIDSANITAGIIEQIDPNRFEILPNPSNSVQLLAFNNKIRPLDDVRVRQAINYTVDIQEIINTAFYGRGEPSGSAIIPALSAYYNANLRNPYPVDLQRARNLLAAAGFANGFSLTITVPSNYTMHIDTAQVLVNQLRRVNILATIKLVDWGTWLSDVYYGRNYEATIISLDASTISPKSFLERYYSSAGNNFMNFNSPRFDRVYGEILNEVNEVRRTSLYKQAQEIISEEAAGVYIQDIWGFRIFPKGRFGGVVHYPLYVVDFSTVYRMQ